jgi:hypothetical protein
MALLASATTSRSASNNSLFVGQGASDQTANTLDDTHVPASQISGVLSVPAQRAMRDSLNVLREMAHLAKNWDSYGGLPPTRIAIGTARALLDNVYSALAEASGDRIQPEIIVPLADGGVQIEWSTHTASVEVQVGPSGTLGYLYVDRSTPETKYNERDDVRWETIFSLIASVILVR